MRHHNVAYLFQPQLVPLLVDHAPWKLKASSGFRKASEERGEATR
jgi:hypothetical protein